MATTYWLGRAVAVAGVYTAQVTAYDAATTYGIDINGVEINVPGNTDVNTTASDLQVALDASTHPYFAALTWTVATDTVTGTADTAGVPHVMTSVATGGTGTMGAVATATAATGPNFWDNADNWSDGSAPSATDDVIIGATDTSIAWALDQTGTTLGSLTILQTFTGVIGLQSESYATSADGETTDSTVPEPRDTYLKIGADTVDIGEHLGPGAPVGSQRIKYHNDKAGACTHIVHDTASSGIGSLPAVRFLGANAAHDYEIRDAPGGVGIATDVPGETATIGDVLVSSDSPATKVYIGSGTTLANYKQRGGNNKLDAAATVTLVQVDGGELDIEGSEAYLITTVTVNGGTVRDKHYHGTAIVTTLNVNDGEYDLRDSDQARTITTVNHAGGQIAANWDQITITTYNEPQSARKRVTVSDA